jgi:hypothetical protein
MAPMANLSDGMLIFVKDIFDIAMHGQVHMLVFIIPVQSYATVDAAVESNLLKLCSQSP